MTQDAAKVVLLVEDDADTRAAIAKGLHFQGFDVVQAHDEASTLGALGRCSPDCILQDLKLRDTDGITLARKYQAILAAQNRLPPILAITGQVLSRQDALASGLFREVLSKPIPSVDLAAIIRGHIKRQPTDPSRKAEARTAMFERARELIAELHDLLGKLDER